MEQDFVVKAVFRLLRTEEGGRQTGIFSGYRPNHVFEYGSDNTMLAGWMGIVLFEGESILPGQEKEVTVKFLREQPIGKYLKIGNRWWIHEGSRKVGEAQITEVLV